GSGSGQRWASQSHAAVRCAAVGHQPARKASRIRQRRVTEIGERMSDVNMNGADVNNNQTGDQLLLSREEAARRLSLSPQTLDKRIKSGAVPVVRIGDRPMIHVDTVREIARKGLK